MSDFGSPIITKVVGPLRTLHENGHIYYTMTVSAERAIIVGHPVQGPLKYAQGQRRKSIGADTYAVNADTRAAWVGLVNWAAEYAGVPRKGLFEASEEESRAFYEPEERTVWERSKSC